MAIPEHVEVVRQGKDAISRWRDRNSDSPLDLRDAKLAGIDLASAHLADSLFLRAELSGANFRGAMLHRVNFFQAVLRDADLSGAIVNGGDLTAADLSGADVRAAELNKADLSWSILKRANLTGAHLEGASFVGTRLEGALLTGCHVYGASVWDTGGVPADQSDLIITPFRTPAITVDNLKVAQFIYLLLHNPEIRDIIDTVTSKVVLILGRFSESRKPVLDSIKQNLREQNLAPVLFDFDRPGSKDITGTVETLARMSRFIIADLTDPSSIPHELATVVPYLRTTPVIPLRLAGTGGYGMFEDLRAYPWVMATHEYADCEQLIAQMPALIAPANLRAEELRARQNAK